MQKIRLKTNNGEMDNIKFIGILGVFMPLISLRIDVFNLYEMSFFMAATIIFGVIHIFRQYLKRNLVSFKIQAVDIVIFLLFAYMLFSLFISVEVKIGIIKIAKFFFLLFLFYLARMIYLNKSNIEQVIKYCIISCSACIVYLSFYYIIVFQKLYIGIDIMQASREGRNSFALVLIIILSFAIGRLQEMKTKKEKRQILPFLIVLLLGLLLLQSRGIIVALFFSLVIVALLNNSRELRLKKSVFTLLIVLTIIMIILPDDLRSQIWYRIQSIFIIFTDNIETAEGIGSINARRDLVSISIEAIKQNPILGIGIGSFKSISSIGYSSPHNDYLYFAVELGLLGFTLYVSLLWSFLKTAFINYRKEKNYNNKSLLIATIAICIYSAFINAYDNFLIWSVYAMVCATYSRISKNKQTTMKMKMEKEVLTL